MLRSFYSSSVAQLRLVHVSQANIAIDMILMISMVLTQSIAPVTRALPVIIRARLITRRPHALHVVPANTLAQLLRTEAQPPALIVTLGTTLQLMQMYTAPAAPAASTLYRGPYPQASATPPRQYQLLSQRPFPRAFLPCPRREPQLVFLPCSRRCSQP